MWTATKAEGYRREVEVEDLVTRNQRVSTKLKSSNTSARNQTIDNFLVNCAFITVAFCCGLKLSGSYILNFSAGLLGKEKYLFQSFLMFHFRMTLWKREYREIAKLLVKKKVMSVIISAQWFIKERIFSTFYRQICFILFTGTTGTCQNRQNAGTDSNVRWLA